jgi:hypothetical protein
MSRAGLLRTPARQEFSRSIGDLNAVHNRLDPWDSPGSAFGFFAFRERMYLAAQLDRAVMCRDLDAFCVELSTATERSFDFARIRQECNSISFRTVVFSSSLVLT